MSIIVRARAPRVLAALLGLAVVLASSSSRAEDDAPSPAPGPDSSFVRSQDIPADPDLLVGGGLAGERDERIGVILAAHPDHDVVICLAGCGGGPKLVAVRSAPQVADAGAASGGALVPAAATLQADDLPDTGDVVCLAGCPGAPGEVVHRAIRLTWVGEGASAEIKAALRSLAERLTSGEVLDGSPSAGREWVSSHARGLLVEPVLPAVLASLVRSAAPLADPGRRAR